jgi:hypothetical protein
MRAIAHIVSGSRQFRTKIGRDVKMCTFDVVFPSNQGKRTPNQPVAALVSCASSVECA